MVCQAGRVTVISRRLGELAAEAGRRPEELLLLPNGADLEGILPLDRAACRAELGLPTEGLYLGYVANYHPDQEFLLRAFAQACRATPELKMIVAGPPFSERLVRELELGGRIVELGLDAIGADPACPWRGRHAGPPARGQRLQHRARPVQVHRIPGGRPAGGDLPRGRRRPVV